MPNREPIAKVDTAWLRMEQPSNLMMITGVVTLAEPIPYERLLDTIRTRWLSFKRFRQKAVDSAGGADWVLDEDFEIHAHVRRVALPGKADQAELEEFVSDLASTALDPSRPLWQFHYIENYTGGPVIVQRIHHCYADGIALVQVFLSLTDSAPEPPPAALDPHRWRRSQTERSSVFRRLTEPARQGLGLAWHWSRKLVGEGVRVVQDPDRAAHYVNEASALSRELVQALSLPDDPPTLFKGRLGVRKRVAWAEPLPLDEVKALSKALGCTVNDLLIATVTGSLNAYLVEKGERPAHGDEIRATVPVNLRPLEHAKDLGNHFGLVFLSLPVGERNPLRRVRAIAEHALTPDAPEPFGRTRTTLARWWERLLIAPNRVNFHMEHHLLITVPHYNLPEMHALLHSRGAIGEECITLGYAEILRNAASRAEDEAKAAAYRPPPRVPPF